MVAVRERAAVRRTARLELVADRSAPRNARAFVGATLTQWHVRRAEDRALLVVSELATWALAHDPGPVFAVCVWRADGLLFVEVADDGIQVPDRARDTWPVAVLDGCAAEWGAEAGTSRVLWAAFDVEVAS